MSNRRVLTDEQEQALAADYLAGVGGQVVLGRKYGVAPGTVRLVLERQGVEARSNAPKVDPKRIVEMFDEGAGLHAIGQKLGVSYSTARKYVLRAGREMRDQGAPATYTFDRAFFDTVDTLRAYWAGFIAADGNLVKNTVRFGLSARDRVILERMRSAARLEQPIAEKRRSGRTYVYLYVTCPEWIAALAEHYDLREHPGGKAGKLVGPPLATPALRWAFLRGFFDGGGSADGSGAVLVSSTSRAFLAWVEEVAGPASSDYGKQIRYGIRDGRAAEVVPLLYAGSTPDTRLARKYERLKRWLPDG